MDAVKVTFDRKCCGCVLANEEILVRTTPSSPVGMHRVVDPAGAALPQAARVLDAGGDLWPDEVRKPDFVIETGEVLDIVATRGKMQNPETGSGGMLVGTVEDHVGAVGVLAAGHRDVEVLPRGGRISEYVRGVGGDALLPCSVVA